MTIAGLERPVLAVLEELGIPYVRIEHPPVITVEEAEERWKGLSGAHCKNLFLRNQRGNRHYLVVAEASRRIDLRELARRIGEDRLSFGSPDRLKKYLGVKPGAVSPFGLIHDEGRRVLVLIEKSLRDSRAVIFHPNVNTASLSLAFADLERFLSYRGNAIDYITL
ncbi:MAG: prolyl-tRNA synthetase associated domain-containing protein [Candidatus Aminicenantales bacterium]